MLVHRVQLIINTYIAVFILLCIGGSKVQVQVVRIETYPNTPENFQEYVNTFFLRHLRVILRRVDPKHRNHKANNIVRSLKLVGYYVVYVM